MELINALRYKRPQSVAFVGAGGKTSAIFKAGRELVAKVDHELPIKTVFVTTSTHIGAWQAKLADQIRFIHSNDDIDKLAADIPHGIMLLAARENNHLLEGIRPDLLGKVFELAKDQNIPLLIEADGSRMHPLKAPAAHEPNIPDFVQTVVVLAGMLGLRKPLAKAWVHRPELFGELAGIKAGETITTEALVKVLISERGGLKNIPSGARKVVILNQADTVELQDLASSMAVPLLNTYHSVVVASIKPINFENLIDIMDAVTFNGETHQVVENIAGIVLAAGGSSRFGRPKQLLEWKGEPLVKHVIRAAREAGLSPVVVILGASAEEIMPIVESGDLRIVINDRWEDGLSGSIKAGVESLPGEIGGAVFLQADQPQIPAQLIKQLVKAHQQTLNPILAPKVNGQRGNPVLFDVTTFSDLKRLTGDMGGRQLFKQYPIEWITWDDTDILWDIDTPEDFQKFNGRLAEREGS
jgi:molybdenum cofactor cytidylyltransferase